MPNLDQDKRFLEAGISVLPDYLLSKELFYPLGGDLPRLTVGNLLLAQLRRRSAGDIEAAEAPIESVRGKWRYAWNQKASREIHSRLGLWRNFLNDYRAFPGGNADRFTAEVRNRVILGLLFKETDQTSERSQLVRMDSRLREGLLPGNFVWENQVEAGFPKPEYWYLYGHLKSR